MVLDPIPQTLPVHFFGSRPQPPTSRRLRIKMTIEKSEKVMCITSRLHSMKGRLHSHFIYIAQFSIEQILTDFFRDETAAW